MVGWGGISHRRVADGVYAVTSGGVDTGAFVARFGWGSMLRWSYRIGEDADWRGKYNSRTTATRWALEDLRELGVRV